MSLLLGICAIGLILLILWEAFETMVQPRRVMHRFRYTRFFYRNNWMAWRFVARRISAGKRREAFLSLFGPASLLVLMATWLCGLIVGFAFLHWALGTIVQAPDPQPGFFTYLYLSGVTFFTVGYGDVAPTFFLGRALAVIEAGMGLGFLAVIIGYLPVLYQAYSRRELTISLLDARAGSPPSAAQLLLRLARSGSHDMIDPFLAEWERWSAELLESHLSFPVLSYYRSQHDNQSWLAALTTVLDACVILLVETKACNTYQAQLTFAMARHAAVDLALVFKMPARPPEADRFTESQRQQLRAWLREAGIELHDGVALTAKQAELRATYEPFVHALAQYFMFSLPSVVPERVEADNWQRSAWMRPMQGIGRLAPTLGDGHFE